MFGVNLKSDVARRARELASRASDLSPTDDETREAVVRQNAAVSFDPDHPASILEVDAGSGRIGSTYSSYTALLTVDDQEIASIQREHILGGDS